MAQDPGKERQPGLAQPSISVFFAPLANSHTEVARMDIFLWIIKLIHFLCNKSIPLMRGTAAVNGWILKALCRKKGYAVGNLRIK